MSDRYVQPLRGLIQILFLLLSLQIIYRFISFLQLALQGVDTALRPAAIDAFLPISGLFGTAAWLKGGGINPVHPAAVVLFVTVVILSWLLRRSFCSWICPIGTISEWLWKLGFSRLHRNWLPPSLLDKGLRGIKYLLMAYFVATAVAWSLPLLQQFLDSDYHAVSDARLLALFRSPSLTTLAVIGLLLILSFPLRNPFCRYLCPYGALLGLLALLSPLTVRREEKRCVSCGVCNQVCPSRLDIMHAKRINSTECLGCWRCISHCRVHTALSMNAFGKAAIPGIIFALLVVLLFWGGTGIGKATGNWEGLIKASDYRFLLSR